MSKNNKSGSDIQYVFIIGLEVQKTLRVKPDLFI